MSFATFLAIISLGQYLVNNTMIVVILLMISITLIVAFAPVDNINKRIKSEKRRKKLKYYSIIVTFILSGLCYLLPRGFLITAILSIMGRL